MLTIETVTPEQAAKWCERVDKRYAEMGWTPDPGVVPRGLVADLGRGWRPLVTINSTTGELYDGASAVKSIVAHGKPVECAVVRAPDDPKARFHLLHRSGLFNALPEGWSFLKMSDEDRPPFAKGLVGDQA